MDGCRVVLNPGQFIDDYLWRLNLRDNKVSVGRMPSLDIRNRPDQKILVPDWLMTSHMT